MKKNIHPTYYQTAKVTCACGQTFEVGSTLNEIRVETCSACHPFYTGKQKILDTGQVKKFEKLLKASAEKKESLRVKNPKTIKKVKKTEQKIKNHKA